MALTEQLPIYRCALRLTAQVAPLIRNFSKHYKYSLGGRLLDLCLDLPELIFDANSHYDKVPYLEELLRRLQRLRMLFNVCLDQRELSERQYAPVAMTLDEIGRQATAWRDKFGRESRQRAEQRAAYVESRIEQIVREMVAEKLDGLGETDRDKQ